MYKLSVSELADQEGCVILDLNVCPHTVSIMGIAGLPIGIGCLDTPATLTNVDEVREFIEILKGDPRRINKLKEDYGILKGYKWLKPRPILKCTWGELALIQELIGQEAHGILALTACLEP